MTCSEGLFVDLALVILSVAMVMIVIYCLIVRCCGDDDHHERQIEMSDLPPPYSV